MIGINIKLLFVRLYLGESRMEVLVEDMNSGEQRLVRYTWHERSPGDVPPKNWVKAIVGEVQYQRGRELKKARGLMIPGIDE